MDRKVRCFQLVLSELVNMLNRNQHGPFCSHIANFVQCNLHICIMPSEANTDAKSL